MDMERKIQKQERKIVWTIEPCLQTVYLQTIFCLNKVILENTNKDIKTITVATINHHTPKE